MHTSTTKELRYNWLNNVDHDQWFVVAQDKVACELIREYADLEVY